MNRRNIATIIIIIIICVIIFCAYFYVFYTDSVFFLAVFYLPQNLFLNRFFLGYPAKQKNLVYVFYKPLRELLRLAIFGG